MAGQPAVTSLFDPSAFIAAEREQTLATIAEPCRACDTCLGTSKASENSHSWPAAKHEIATIAGIAAPDPEESVWTAGPKLLAALPRPVRLKGSVWAEIVRQTKWIADDWAGAAASAGWDPHEFYGCNPDPFVGRVDRDGLTMTMIRMTSPCQVTAIYSDRAVFTCRDGSTMTMRHFGPRGQVFLWEAYAMKGGP